MIARGVRGCYINNRRPSWCHLCVLLGGRSFSTGSTGRRHENIVSDESCADILTMGIDHWAGVPRVRYSVSSDSESFEMESEATRRNLAIAVPRGESKCSVFGGTGTLSRPPLDDGENTYT